MSSTPRVLVVDDDPKTVAALRLYLERAGFQVDTASDGEEALGRARSLPSPDLVVLDRMLPRRDGLTICRTLRRESNVPIILLTARTAENERLEGLEHGADDYVTKPFSPRELVARVKTVLRRARPDRSAASVLAGPLVIDPSRHEVRAQGREVTLTPREFALLLALARRPARVFTRRELCDLAFGDEREVLDRTVDVHIMNLRRKLTLAVSDAVRIETVFAVGYRLSVPPEMASAS